MEPQVQYTKTEDGVNIAYALLGKGPPLLYCCDLPNAHIQLDWGQPIMRQLYGMLTSRPTLIRFDPRGIGLSDRTIGDFTLESRLLDMEAVTEDLGLETFDVIAVGRGGPLAVSYAVRHPKRVSHLFLWNTFAAVGERVDTAREIVDQLVERHWEVFTEVVSGLAFGFGDFATHYAEFFRACITHDAAKVIYRAIDRDDVTRLLPRIEAPTLVIQHDGMADRPIQMGRNLASRIPKARLIVVGGTWADSHDDIARAMNEFVGEGDAPNLPEGMTAILFLDIADSTALTTQLGDAVYREKERGLDAALRAAITDAGGTPVEGKVLGDGVMAVFTAARQAIDAAQRCRQLGNDAGLPLHLGIHAGDVVREGNNVHGGAVQLASRVQGAANPGEILVSATVRDLARTSAGVAFEDRGEHELKGITEPQRLFAVREQE